MIEISFHDTWLETLLQDDKALFKKIKNKKLVQKVIDKMWYIHATKSLADFLFIPGLRLHALTEDLKGMYSLDIPDKLYGLRVIFIPLNGDNISQDIITNLPPNSKLFTITKIHIISRCDDHIKSEKDSLKKIFQLYQ